jgi:hypothetical protein
VIGEDIVIWTLYYGLLVALSAWLVWAAFA